MGILNVTCDSFSNDGIYQDPQQALERARQMAAEGADIIDVGGESTRPGARTITAEEECLRVLPVIEKLAQEIKLPISIDTTKAIVAQRALAAGASIVNDISALKFDAQMGQVIAHFGAGCILMHIQGTAQTMQNHPDYTCLIDEIKAGLRAGVGKATAAGIERNRIVIDPGIGFGKTTEHNLQIIKHLGEFACLDLPVLLGASRKSFIGNVLKLPVDERLLGTAAAVAAGIINGAQIIRVHDVGAMAQTARMIDAIVNS